MKKVLFVSYFFPPIHCVESTMAFNAVKYLPKTDWFVDVVSVKASREWPSNIFYTDKAMPSHLQIYRTNSFENLITRIMNRLWLLPDSSFGWIFYAISQAKNQLQKNGADIMISRSNPITSHLAALYLKRSYSVLPWVAMFGDPWADNPYTQHLPAWVQSWRRYLERQIIKSADKIIVTTTATKEFFVNRHGNSDKFIVMPNTYDPEEIADFITENNQTHRLVMVHAGNLYGLRSPASLFQALDLLKQESWFGNIQLKLLGNISQFKDLITQYELGDVIEIKEMMPKREALKEMSNSVALVLIDAPSSGYSMFLPAKLVEYLALQKPILGLTSTGASADLIRQSQSGLVVDPIDPYAIANAIRQFYDAFISGKLRSQSHPEIIVNYSARTYGEKLSTLMRELIV